MCSLCQRLLFPGCLQFRLVLLWLCCKCVILPWRAMISLVACSWISCSLIVASASVKQSRKTTGSNIRVNLRLCLLHGCRLRSSSRLQLPLQGFNLFSPGCPGFSLFHGVFLRTSSSCWIRVFFILFLVLPQRCLQAPWSWLNANRQPSVHQPFPSVPASSEGHRCSTKCSIRCSGAMERLCLVPSRRSLAAEAFFQSTQCLQVEGICNY